MTDEDAFRAAIDAAPDNAILRLVYCDWLAERGDPRETGHRFLAETGRAAYAMAADETDPACRRKWAAWYPFFVGTTGGDPAVAWYEPHWLPPEVYAATDFPGKVADLLPSYATLLTVVGPDAHHGPRWAVEDAVALGFGRLPADVRAGLLAAGRVARDSRLSKPLPLLTEPA